MEIIRQTAVQDSDKQDYQSPIILRLEAESLPKLETICEYCPLAKWIVTGELKCYCQMMYTISWEKQVEENPILMCDGQIKAIIEWKIAQEQ